MLTAARIDNLLYARPHLYELVYPDPDEEIPNVCRHLFARYLPTTPASILDIGCGTGRDLAAFVREIPDCWGVDANQSMLDYARSVHPYLHLQVGDMRSVRLGRSFDCITCIGSVIMYALTNADLRLTLDTFAAHAHRGTLLILELNNAMSFLQLQVQLQLQPGDGLPLTQERVVSTPTFSATAHIRNRLDRRHQHWIRERTWYLADGATADDYCTYRLLFPAELEQLLADREFRTLGMFDNELLTESDFSGPRLYVAAIYEPAA
jgi:SAM-dependent methyltransferase